MSPVLPFNRLAQLIEQGGAVVHATMPVGVWPAGSERNAGAGRHHTHRGEAPIRFAVDLQVPNRSLVLDGEAYKIMAATPMDLVPHVALELNRTSGRS